MSELRSQEQSDCNTCVASSLTSHHAPSSSKARPKLTVRIPGKDISGPHSLPSLVRAVSIDDTTTGSTSHLSLGSVNLSSQSDLHLSEHVPADDSTGLKKGHSTRSGCDGVHSSTDLEKEQLRIPVFDYGRCPPSPDSYLNQDLELYQTVKREYYIWCMQNSPCCYSPPYVESSFYGISQNENDWHLRPYRAEYRTPYPRIYSLSPGALQSPLTGRSRTESFGDDRFTGIEIPDPEPRSSHIFNSIGNRARRLTCNGMRTAIRMIISGVLALGIVSLYCQPGGI